MDALPGGTEPEPAAAAAAPDATAPHGAPQVAQLVPLGALPALAPQAAVHVPAVSMLDLLDRLRAEVAPEDSKCSR